MSTATSGRAREHKVRDDLVSRGWLPIMRAAASKGPADLFLAHPVHGGALIQVGTGNKYLSPAARDRLCTAAEMCGALPLLAVAAPRQPIAYWWVTRGTAGTWSRWEGEE